MSKTEKNRHTVWLSDESWEMVNQTYQQANFSTRNEFIEQAIRFYTGWHCASCTEPFLPTAIAGLLHARWDAAVNRICSLLFKCAVELNICNHLLALDVDMDYDTYQKLRSLSKQEVRSTNGYIKLIDAVEQKQRTFETKIKEDTE